MVDAESLAEVLDDPAHFDLDEINEALGSPFLVLRERGADPRLVDLVGRLTPTDVGADFAARAVQALDDPGEPDPETLRAALRPYQWFLDRAQGDGIALTASGYLKPADVEAACAMLPGMSEWLGKNNRETHAAPLLDFRKSLQSMGLLRKHKGALLLTRAAASARRDPSKLWRHLASRLVPSGDADFETQATLVLLVFAATTEGEEVPDELIGSALSELGWRYDDGRPLAGYEIRRLPAYDALTNLTDTPASGWRGRISPMGSSLARAALRHGA